MIKTLIIATLVLILNGCCTPKTITRTVEVKVPVPIPVPEPKDVPRPSLLIYNLTEADKANPGKVVQYYEATIKQLQGYSLELETILNGYRTKKDLQDK